MEIKESRLLFKEVTVFKVSGMWSAQRSLSTQFGLQRVNIKHCLVKFKTSEIVWWFSGVEGCCKTLLKMIREHILKPWVAQSSVRSYTLFAQWVQCIAYDMSVINTMSVQKWGFYEFRISRTDRTSLRKMPLKLGIPIAWYNARIPEFPRKSIREGASSLFGRGPERPQMSLALGQPQGCTGASLGCSRARDIFGFLRPSPEKTTCSFPDRFSGKNTGIRALYQAIGIPTLSLMNRPLSFKNVLSGP